MLSHYQVVTTFLLRTPRASHLLYICGSQNLFDNDYDKDNDLRECESFFFVSLQYLMSTNIFHITQPQYLANKMKNVHNTFVLTIFTLLLMSCVNQEKHYSEMAITASGQLENSPCKDCFWGIEVSSRVDKKFSFTDSKKRTVAYLYDTAFIIDTIYHEQCSPVKGTRELDTVEMKEIALCFKDLDIGTIMGIETDTSRYLLCYINKCVTLYYVPDMSRNSPSEIERFKNRTTKINEFYYYVLHEDEFELFWGSGYRLKDIMPLCFSISTPRKIAPQLLTLNF